MSFMLFKALGLTPPPGGFKPLRGGRTADAPPADKKPIVVAQADPVSATGSKPPARGLTDDDFPTDKTARLHEDEAIAQRRRDDARNPKPQPKPAEPEVVDPLVKEAEDAIGDPAKRMKAMADAKLPRFEAEFENDTALDRIGKDFQSALEKATEYTTYINKTMEFVIKTGNLTHVKDVVETATRLKAMSSSVLGSLGKAANLVEKVRDGVKLLEESVHFAKITEKLDMQKIETVQAWVKASKSLYNAAAPFFEWAQKAAVEEAFAGSAIAGELAASIPIAGAELMVALKTLDAGLANEKAYFARYQKMMHQIFEDEGAAPPPTPQPWESRESQAIKAGMDDDDRLRRFVSQRKQWAADDKRRKAEQAEAEEREKHKKEIDAAAAALKAAKEEFEKTNFVKVYQRARTSMAKKIHAQVRSRQPGASAWLYCFHGKPEVDMNVVSGIVELVPLASVSDAEALMEIHDFRDVRPTCPLFERLHETAWNAYAKKKGV